MDNGKLLDLFNRLKALLVHDWCLLSEERERVVIPPAVSEGARIHFHSNRQGTNKLKSTARHRRIHRSAGLRLPLQMARGHFNVIDKYYGHWQSVLSAEYCKNAAIEHIHSHPYHPQSNRQANKFVDIVKRDMLITNGERGTYGVIEKIILNHRTNIHPTLNS